MCLLHLLLEVFSLHTKPAEGGTDLLVLSMHLANASTLVPRLIPRELSSNCIVLVCFKHKRVPFY